MNQRCIWFCKNRFAAATSVYCTLFLLIFFECRLYHVTKGITDHLLMCPVMPLYCLFLVCCIYFFKPGLGLHLLFHLSSFFQPLFQKPSEVTSAAA